MILSCSPKPIAGVSLFIKLLNKVIFRLAGISERFNREN